MIGDKIKTDEMIEYSPLAKSIFIIVWLVIGIIAFAISLTIALVCFISYGRDMVFAFMAGNAGDLILNLIAFILLGCGGGISAYIVGYVGGYAPIDTIADGDTNRTMNNLRKDIYAAIAKKQGK